MKKKDILIGTFMIICSLSAYIFLVQMQSNEDIAPNKLYTEQIDQDETITSPDVSVFKYLVNAVTKLLPAS